MVGLKTSLMGMLTLEFLFHSNFFSINNKPGIRLKMLTLLLSATRMFYIDSKPEIRPKILLVQGRSQNPDGWRSSAVHQISHTQQELIP